MPRSDLTAQRSITLVDDLNNAGVNIPDIERTIGLFDEYIILRIQTTAAQTGFVSCCKQDFFLCHSMVPFCLCVPPGHGCARRDGDCGLSRRLQYKERISRWLSPWRKGQNSNLLPSPVPGAAHPHELPFHRVPPCRTTAKGAIKLIGEKGIEPSFSCEI